MLDRMDLFGALLQRRLYCLLCIAIITSANSLKPTFCSRMHLWCNYEFVAAELSLSAFDISPWMIKHFVLSDCLLSPLYSLFTKRLADRLMMSDSFFLSFFLYLLLAGKVYCHLSFILLSRFRQSHFAPEYSVWKKMTFLEIFNLLCSHL